MKVLARSLLVAAIAVGFTAVVPSVAHAAGPVSVFLLNGFGGVFATPSTVTATQMSIAWDPSAGNAFAIGVVSSDLSVGGTPCTANPFPVCLVWPTGHVVFDVDPSATTNRVANFVNPDGTPNGGSFIFTYDFPPDPTPSNNDTGPGPQAVIQEFGKPTGVICDEAASKNLNWGGASSGQWGVSWSHWVNGGVGGAVYTRTLTYDGSVGHWVAG